MRYIKEYSEYYYKVPTYGMEWPKTVTPTPNDIKMDSILDSTINSLKNIYLDKLLKESDKYYYPRDQFPLRPFGVSDLLSMSNAAIDAIKDLFPNTFVDYVEDKKYISVHNNPTIHIYQYDDEWYLARVNKQLNKSYHVKYYWCDQVEGVIQLLSYFYHDQNLNERI